MINKRLVEIRKKIKENRKFVVDTLLKDHSSDICIICGITENLTKEHVVPKWTFENNQKKDFITGINGLRQSYSTTTLPACAHCNSYLLGALENYLEQLFRHKELGIEYFDNKEKSKIIFWLEFIDYKFQALDLKRKFIKPKDGQYIKFLADLPVGVMQRIELSPSEIFSTFRDSLKKLSIKDRSKQLNSLVSFSTTKNDTFHFFHHANEFIFIELPQYSVALFYHLNKTFDNEKSSYDEAMKIIERVY